MNTLKKESGQPVKLCEFKDSLTKKFYFMPGYMGEDHSSIETLPSLPSPNLVNQWYHHHIYMFVTALIDVYKLKEMMVWCVFWNLEVFILLDLKCQITKIWKILMVSLLIENIRGPFCWKFIQTSIWCFQFKMSES